MKSNLLWTPDSAKELLAVELQDAGSATDAEFDQMLFINQSIVDWLNGKLDTGTLTDTLLQYDVEPEILDRAESHLQLLWVAS